LFAGKLFQIPPSVCLHRWEKVVNNRTIGTIGLEPRKSSSIRDGYPQVFKAGSFHFTTCLIQKCGSFNFYEILKVLNATLVRDSSALFAHPSVMRYTIVRNPYARLVSAFYDKFAMQKDFKGKNFSQFVDFLYTRWVKYDKRWKLVTKFKEGSHVRPMTLYCKMNDGFAYDYIFNLEESQMWVPELFRLFEVSNGEKVAHRDVSLTNCPSPNWNMSTCEDYFHKRACRSHVDPSIASRKIAHKPRHANNKYASLYNTDAILKVNDMYFDDFMSFNYPFWEEIL